MLKELRLQNCVKHKDRTFVFEKGLTIIKGQNGNGKSLIQEMIRFALFGSLALRGKVSDYDSNMKVSLKCEINGENVFIVRTLKDCEINGVIKGTTPCNLWIINKLGYDLTVFDMGNAAKQGEIAKLGKMKPSERKLAIDQIIGLTAVTKIIKELKEKKNEIKNYITGYQTALFKPEEPKKPDNYIESNIISAELANKRSIKSNFDICKAKAEEYKCEKPFWRGDIPEGDLKNEPTYIFIKNKLAQLGENANEGSKYTEEQLDNLLIRSYDWKDYIEPEISKETYKEYVEKWNEYKSYLIKKSAYENSKVICPKCGEEFSPNKEEPEKVEKPDLEEDYLRIQNLRIGTRPKTIKPDFFIDKDFVASEKVKISKKKDYENYIATLNSLGEADYDKLREFDNYKKQLDKWNNYEVYLQKLNSMVNVPSSEELSNMETLLITSKVYEESLKKYEYEKLKYEESLSLIEEKKVEMSDYENAINGLSQLMTTVKNSVIPSLSKVSSDLVSEMTNGKLNNIKIDDDFSITADGKEICLLSGGEEAGVNLAIRLALSSILTRKVFNVFIGDEVDQSMDDERAKLTADTLRKLNSQIEQMILITHKDVEGDNLIDI